jgi:chromosome segregation ATPase
MSGMGSTMSSVLPEDIEEKLKNVQKIIADLESQKTFSEKEAEVAKAELATITKLLESARTDFDDVTSKIKLAESKFAEKEGNLARKESALEVYANALVEKEKKINKYIAVFDNMKGIIS